MKRVLIFPLLALLCTSCVEHYAPPALPETGTAVYLNWEAAFYPLTQNMGDIVQFARYLQEGDTLQAEKFLAQNQLLVQGYRLPADTVWHIYPQRNDPQEIVLAFPAADTWIVTMPLPVHDFGEHLMGDKSVALTATAYNGGYALNGEGDLWNTSDSICTHFTLEQALWGPERPSMLRGGSLLLQTTHSGKQQTLTYRYTFSLSGNYTIEQLP